MVDTREGGDQHLDSLGLSLLPRLVPFEFVVPTELVVADRFILRMLSTSDLDLDFEAVMEGVQGADFHLRRVF